MKKKNQDSNPLSLGIVWGGAGRLTKESLRLGGKRFGVLRSSCRTTSTFSTSPHGPELKTAAKTADDKRGLSSKGKSRKAGK